VRPDAQVFGRKETSMIQLDGTLTELARLRSGSEPIVSLTLDVRWGDEQQRERVRLFVQERVRQLLIQYPAGTPGRDGLVRTLARIQEHVSALTGRLLEEERRGHALFACDSLGLWRPLFFSRPLENALDTDAIPHLLRLARLVDDLAPAIVVVPSQEGADIAFVRLGEIEAEATVRGLVPRHDEGPRLKPSPPKPGQHFERQEKNERHLRSFLDKNRKAAAAQVTALFDQRPGAKIVLVGTAEALAAFERELPERVSAEIVARVPRPREWASGDGVRRDGVKAVATKVLAREREDERRIVDAVVGQALRGGLGVLGPDDVVLALNEGRVHTLVIEEDFRRSGYRCDNCGALGAKAEAAVVCPFCAGDLRVVHDLREALVATALAAGGRVEVLPHGNKLHSYRGVGAFLRQTTATGLRGASPPSPSAPGASQP
jgi:peptide subunit release factor 1 (eRF1)